MTTLNEIQNNLNRIKETLLEADVEFRIYCHLLKMKSNYRRINFYNEHITFFHYQQNSLLYSFIMKIMKLCEPAEMRGGRDKNATFLYLNEELFSNATQDEKKEIDKIIKHLRTKTKKLDLTRNKEIAHLDRKSKRKDFFNEKIVVVRRILNNQLKLLNIYNRILHRISYQKIHFEPRLGEELKKLFSVLFKEYKHSLSKTKEQHQLDKKINLAIAKSKFSEHIQIENKLNELKG